MTITTITRDRRYPQPGEVVTLLPTFDAGTRCRFRLLSKPTESKLPIWDDAKDNYLVRDQLTPDVPGVYCCEGVQETVSVNAPRFSNDLGVSANHPTEIRGVEQVMQLPVVLRYTIPVVEKVTRQIGSGSDTATIELHCCGSIETVDVAIPTHWIWNPVPLPGHLEADEWVHELRPAVEGVITRCADRTLAPKLSNVNSDLAKYAATHADVLLALRELGGADYGDSSYRAGEDSEIVSWESCIWTDPYEVFRQTVDAFNGHAQSVADLRVHDVADNVNVAPPSTGGTPANQAVFLNAILLTMIAHASHAAHPTADAILLAALLALVPLGASPSQDECCGRTNELWRLLDEHLTRIYLPGVTPQVHLQEADRKLNSALYPKAVDAGTAVSRQGALKSAYDDHRVRVSPYVGGHYHEIAATSAEKYTDALPDNRDTLPTAVGTLATLLVKHMGNVSAAGVSTGYHAAMDSSVLAILRSAPTDFASAIETLEAIRWQLAKHARRGAPHHDTAWAGAADPAVYGLEALAHAWLTATVEPLPAVLLGNSDVASVRLAAAGWRTA